MDLGFIISCKHFCLALRQRLSGRSLNNRETCCPCVFGCAAATLRGQPGDHTSCQPPGGCQAGLGQARRPVVTVWNGFSVCRASSGMSGTPIPETETRTQQHPPQEGDVESTTLQIRPAPPSQDREPCTVPIQSGVPLTKDQGGGPTFPGSREETGLSCPETPHTPASPKGHSREELVRPGPVVELQLSLSQEVHTGTGVPVVALLGAETSQGPDPGPNLDCSGVAHINSAPSGEKAAPPLRSSKITQIRSSQELRVTQGREAGGAGLPRLEVIFDCADRQQTEGCRLPAAAGGVDSPGEGGQSEAPPSLVAFAVSSEGTEPGEEPRRGRDHSRPHKHRARHARESCGGARGWGPGCPAAAAAAWPFLQ